MKKIDLFHMSKKNRYFLLTVSALICSSLHSEAAPSIPLHATLKEKSWAETLIEQHSELLWLATDKVRKTEEGFARQGQSYSEALFGQKYAEFDRTLLTLSCLNWIVEGSREAYETFSNKQPSATRLSWPSFQLLHQEAKELLNARIEGLSSQETLEALTAGLLLGDMGKSEQARLLFQTYGVTAIDHDDFYEEALHILEKHPELCPTFSRLSPGGKKLLIQSSNLAHYGHITHLEGRLEIFKRLKDSPVPTSSPLHVRFALLIQTCDVAGALGHLDGFTSLSYTEETHNALQAMGRSVKLLCDPRKTELDAYNSYLAERASWVGLNPQNRIDCVLSRTAAMLRLFNREQGALLKEAFALLDAETQNLILSQLDVDNTTSLGRTPTYMPALLVNLANNPLLGSTPKERLAEAVKIGLPFLARVLKAHQELIASGKIDPRIPLNFNAAAGIAKNAPHLLKGAFQIDPEGSVRPDPT